MWGGGGAGEEECPPAGPEIPRESFLTLFQFPPFVHSWLPPVSHLGDTQHLYLRRGGVVVVTKKGVIWVWVWGSQATCLPAVGLGAPCNSQFHTVCLEVPAHHSPIRKLPSQASGRPGAGLSLLTEYSTGGVPSSSASKEFACNAGDPSSIPGWGRSPGEGIGYTLQYSWASQVAQPVKNLPAMWETWFRFLGWEDPLEKGTATYSGILAWRIPCGSQSQTGLSDFHMA